MPYIHHEFKNIYKAKQCSDLNDVNTALRLLKGLAEVLGCGNGPEYTPAMRRRLVSLEKRKKLLSK